METQEKFDAIPEIKSSSSISASLIDLTEVSQILRPSFEQVKKGKKKKKKTKKMIKNTKGVDSLAITEEQSE
jgi:hypothetical protein